MDSTLGFLTPIPFGMPEFMKSLLEIDKEFYLVEQRDEQLFVTVTDGFLDICPLRQKQTQNAFQLGGWAFIKGNYLLEE